MRARSDRGFAARLISAIRVVVDGPWTSSSSMTEAQYTLHYYDHCPFGHRVHILLHRFGIKYGKVCYGYGDGARPAECEGEGYGEGPRVLTGSKQLPVLVGANVPCAPGAKGMPESLDICSFLIAAHGLSVPCATNRQDVDKFVATLRELSDPLTVPRNPKMPVPDWADPRDISYFLHKKRAHGLVPLDEEAEEALKAKVNALLLELPPLLRGNDCLNAWGWGMDDVMFFPWLRRLTMIKGIEYPPAVAAYMAATTDELVDYRPHAL